MEENNKKVSREMLHQIADRFDISAERSLAYFRAAGIYPDAGELRTAFSRLTGGGAVLFLLVGTVFFFAFNWADMHHFVKFGLILSLLTAAGLAVIFLPAQKMISEVIALVFSVLVGVFFAVFGQHYQTGADAYDFFLAWTALISPVVLFAGYAPLWVLFQVLVNLTVLTYMAQVLRVSPEENYVIAGLIFLNFSASVGWEFARRKSEKFGIPLHLSVISWGILATVLVCESFFNSGSSPDELTGFFALISFALLAGTACYYYFRRFEALLLAAFVLSGIIIFNSLVLSFSDFDEGVYLLLSFADIGFTAAGAVMLKRHFDKKKTI